MVGRQPLIGSRSFELRVVDPIYFCRLLRLSYLAPDITAAILDSRQPAHLNRYFIARIDNLPIDWPGQRALLGIG